MVVEIERKLILSCKKFKGLCAPYDAVKPPRGKTCYAASFYSLAELGDTSDVRSHCGSAQDFSVAYVAVNKLQLSQAS